MKSNEQLVTNYLLAGVSFIFIFIMIGSTIVCQSFGIIGGLEVDTRKKPVIDVNVKISEGQKDTSYCYKFVKSDFLKIKKVD